MARRINKIHYWPQGYHTTACGRNTIGIENTMIRESEQITCIPCCRWLGIPRSVAIERHRKAMQQR